MSSQVLFSSLLLLSTCNVSPSKVRPLESDCLPMTLTPGLIPIESRMREAECKLALSEAENLERDKNFTEAGKRFADAIGHLLGQDVKIPIDATNDGGVRFPVYLKLTMDECLTAMTCANAISRCMFESGRLAEVGAPRR